MPDGNDRSKKTFSRRELRWFGPLFALFIALIGWMLWESGVGWNVLSVLAIAAGSLIVVYYLVPPLQRPLYRGWMFSVMPIGWIVSHLLLSVIYYLLLTPIGLIMKAVGYDPMRRKLEPNRETYWVNRQKSEDPQRYFKQY